MAEVEAQKKSAPEVCRCCGQRTAAVTVETVRGEYVDTYWPGDYFRLGERTATQAARDRIKHLKERWNIDARIREAA